MADVASADGGNDNYQIVINKSIRTVISIRIVLKLLLLSQS